MKDNKAGTSGWQYRDYRTNGTKNRRNARTGNRKSKGGTGTDNRTIGTPAQPIVQQDTRTNSREKRLDARTYNRPVKTIGRMADRTDDTTEGTPRQTKKQFVHHDRS